MNLKLETKLDITLSTLKELKNELILEQDYSNAGKIRDIEIVIKNILEEFKYDIIEFPDLIKLCRKDVKQINNLVELNFRKPLLIKRLRSTDRFDVEYKNHGYTSDCLIIIDEREKEYYEYQLCERIFTFNGETKEWVLVTIDGIVFIIHEDRTFDGFIINLNNERDGYNKHCGLVKTEFSL